MHTKTTKNQPAGGTASRAGTEKGKVRQQRRAGDATVHLSTLIANGATPTRIQPKLTVGQPGDRFEQEADRMAEKVMTAPAPLQRRSDMPEEEALQRQPLPEEKETARRQPVEEEPPLVQKAAEEEPETQPREEEEEVRRQPEVEEEPPSLQKMTDEEIDIQPQMDEEEPELQRRQEEDEEEMLQRQPGESAPTISPTLESRLAQSKTGGSPLPETTRRQMEPHFGADFSGVRVHTDAAAAQMSRSLGARAFTHGNHIFFNSGQFNPDTAAGQRLLAHELTHTVQQGGGVQRQGDNAEESTLPQNPTRVESEEGTLDLVNRRLHIRNLPLPRFKYNARLYPNPPFKIPERRERNSRQRENWDAFVQSGAGLEQKLEQLYARQIPPVTPEGNTLPRYYLKTRQQNIFVVGTKSEIKNRVLRPFWDPEGRAQLYHVDHKVELQLGGADEPGNYWLLSADANVASGRLIRNARDQRIRAILEAGQRNETLRDRIPTYDEVRSSRYEIWVDRVSPGPVVRGVKTITPEEARSGKTVEGLREVPGDDLVTLRGSPNELVIFTNPTGGGIRRIRWEPDMTVKEDLSDVPNRDRTIGENFFIDRVTYSKGSGGTVAGRAFKGGHTFVQEAMLTFPIKEFAAVDFGGYIPARSVRAEANKLIANFLSPIEFTEAGIDPVKGLFGRGKILPSIPIISNAEIELVMMGNLVELRKTFGPQEFQVPEPFEVYDASLSIFAGSRGLGVEGRVNFGIRNVGDGFIGAAARSSGGFELEGEFNFDTRLFDPARIGVSYRDEVFSAEGEIGIPEGKIRGIKSARITAQYSEGVLNAAGEAELDIPGIERGRMAVNYAEDEFSIAGEFQLSSEIPGIRGGVVSAEVRQVEGEEGYQVFVRGTADPDIPGINTTLSVAYEDGAITIEGRGDYRRGLLSGQILLGVTNRPIGEDGQPAGEPGSDLRVYGGGNLTVQLTPWLAATAGVRFTPEGEIEVRGEIGLPAAVEIFPRKSVEMTIFRMPTLEIPLFAIPLGPRSIGLVATISGGLEAEAGIGPGQITDLSVSVTYNPAREEETTISGTGRFVVPADAGLRLFARAGIGLSVGVARVSGNIEVGGALGLEGAAEAAVSIEWSPAAGLELMAQGRIFVQPKFVFDISAVLEATLDLFLFDISKEWRRTLASFEYGPDLRFGIIFPIHYIEGQPFDISLDDVEFETPEIDIPQFVKGLGRRVLD